MTGSVATAPTNPIFLARKKSAYRSFGSCCLALNVWLNEDRSPLYSAEQHNAVVRLRYGYDVDRANGQIAFDHHCGDACGVQKAVGEGDIARHKPADRLTSITALCGPFYPHRCKERPIYISRGVTN